ncbi:MAG TPA: DEAD/DEAH box helicase [Luteibaculaceae bacterium]|nr:DEAD/DEAH box helicase [Luteibaculaceae bacterium]
MFYPKIQPEFQENLNRLNLNAANEFQLNVFKKMRSGADVVAIAEAGTGKTTGIITTLIHQLKEAFEDAPRALIIVNNRAEVEFYLAQFAELGRHTDLRVKPAFEGKPWKDQMEEIYIGADVVVGTIGRIQEIYFKNGINLNKIKHLIIENAHNLTHQQVPQIERLLLTLEKCQRTFVGQHITERIERIADEHLKKVEWVE